MSSSIAVELDTTAPVVSFSEVNLLPNSLLKIMYGISEPDIDSADLEISGIDSTPMSIINGELSATIPPTEESIANIKISTTDYVLNNIIQNFPIALFAKKTAMKHEFFISPIVDSSSIEQPNIKDQIYENPEIDSRSEPKP